MELQNPKVHALQFTLRMERVDLAVTSAKITLRFAMKLVLSLQRILVNREDQVSKKETGKKIPTTNKNSSLTLDSHCSSLHSQSAV